MYSSIPSRSDNNAAKAGPRPGFFDAAGIQAPARRPDTGRLKKRLPGMSACGGLARLPSPDDGLTASMRFPSATRRAHTAKPSGRGPVSWQTGLSMCFTALCPAHTAKSLLKAKGPIPPRHAAWRGGPGRNSAGSPLPREKAASLCKSYAMGPAQAGHKKERVWARSFFIQWGKAKRHSRHVGDSLSGIFDEGMVCFKQALSPETGNFRWRRHPALRCR